MATNYRTSGLAEVAQAIEALRPRRCSREVALHAINVMAAMQQSGETGRSTKTTTTCERPKELGPKEAPALMLKGK